MDALTIAAFALVILCAAAAQAITGFGFALLSLAVLGNWMDLREASAMIAPAGIAVNTVLFLRLRSHFSWDGFVPLFIAHLAAVPFGGLLLLYANQHVLELILAGVMLLGSAQGFLMAGPNERPWHPVKAGVPCGFFGGLLTGSFGTGGPPLVLYLSHRPIDRFRYIASMQAMIGVGSGLRLAQLIFVGRVNAHHLPLILPSLLAVGLGTFLGLRLLHILSDRTVRRVMLAFLFVGGLRYALSR